MRGKQSDIYYDDIVISTSLCKEITLIKKALRLTMGEKVSPSIIRYRCVRNESDLNNDQTDNQQCWILFK